MNDGSAQLRYHLRNSSYPFDFAWFNEIECFYLLDNGTKKLNFSTAFWRSAAFFYLPTFSPACGTGLMLKSTHP